MQQFILCMRCGTGANSSTHATSSLRSKTSSKDSICYENEKWLKTNTGHLVNFNSTRNYLLILR